MEQDTIVRIMSMTKALAAAAILCLVDDGVLTLTDHVWWHIPEFKNPKVVVRTADVAPNDVVLEASGGYKLDEGYSLVAAKTQILVKDLLLHSSGLP